MNSINIASSLLNELYSNGFTFPDMYRKYLYSNNGTLERLIDAFANAHGYYNHYLYGNGYYNNIIQNYIITTVKNINSLYRENILARRNN